MKKARSGDCEYFNGSLCDEKARVRLYGHNAGAHKKLSKFFETADSVSLNNCQVKPTRAGDGYEVARRRTLVLSSSSFSAILNFDNRHVDSQNWAEHLRSRCRRFVALRI